MPYNYPNGFRFAFWGNKVDDASFHGTPHITVHKKTAPGPAIICIVIKNTKQPLQPCQINNICVPQKLGEVVAQVHFLAAATFLWYGLNGDVPSEVKAKGLLIDKTRGGYEVDLEVHINSIDNSVPVYIILKQQDRLGVLKQAILCYCSCLVHTVPPYAYIALLHTRMYTAHTLCIQYVGTTDMHCAHR